MSKVITDNTSIKVRINKLLSHGRVEITTRKELQKYPIGSLISHIDDHGIFKLGGYLCRVEKDSFVYKTLDFDQKIRARFDNIKKMWVGDVFEVTGDYISFKNTTPKTNYPVSIGKYIVYYCKQNGDRDRYTVTNKYERMVKWHKYFHGN